MDKVFKCLGATNHAVGERQEEDYYSTPEYVTNKILKWVKENLPESSNWNVWEPAVGGGRMVNSLKENGFNVVACSDVVDRGFPNVEILDFLKAEKKDNVNCIFTNPPYSKALEFAEKALGLLNDGDYYCFLGRIQFLEGKKRREFFNKNPPKNVLVFSERVDCWKDDKKPKSSSAMCYAFFIFKKGFSGKPTIDWI